MLSQSIDQLINLTLGIIISPVWSGNATVSSPSSVSMTWINTAANDDFDHLELAGPAHAAKRGAGIG